MHRSMPTRRAEPTAAVGREDSPSEVQMTRAFIAVALGLMMALWMLRPQCVNPSVSAMLPEFRKLTGIPSLVI
jgi:hypothetical protein